MSDPKKMASSADCGCRVEISSDFASGEDELVVYPCSAEHEPTLAAAARNLAEQAGIEYVERSE